jgi:hypothetical protein
MIKQNAASLQGRGVFLCLFFVFGFSLFARFSAIIGGQHGNALLVGFLVRII